MSRFGPVRNDDFADMPERERELHLKYGLPATVDLSEAALSAAADRARRSQDAAVARVMASLGVDATRGDAWDEVDPSVRAAGANLARRAEQARSQGGHGGAWLVGGVDADGVANWALRTWRADGWSGSQTTESAYYNAVRACFQPGGGDSADVDARYINAPLLVIQDVLVCDPTRWSVGELWRVVQHRFQSRLPLIVTSPVGLQRACSHWALASEQAAQAIEERLRIMCVELGGGPAQEN